MPHRKIVLLGGACLVLAALAFVVVFSYLAAKFDYPAVLDGSASEVLPRLRSGGATMRAVWAIYAFIPLLLIPAAVGALFACPASRPRMTLGLAVATLASLAMCLGLMRWPSIHWALAGSYATAAPATRDALSAVFDGLNLYLGNYLGEFLGELALSAFFALTAASMLAETRFPKWLGWAGLACSLLFVVGAFRNVAATVQPVADINNTLLPLWMIVLGVALAWCSRPAADPAAPKTA